MIIKITKYDVEITKRFFQALEALSQMKKMRGLKSFSTKYGLNYWNLRTLRNEPEKRLLKVSYLYYLVTDYNISAQWLLTGEGEMLKKRPKTR